MSNASEQKLRANKKRELYESIAKKWFLFNALVAIISVAAIAFFVFYKGLQPFFPGNEAGTTSFIEFISKTEWKPGKNTFGILYMIVGSVLATSGAILIGVPIGIMTAVFIAEIAPPYLRNIIKPAVELLAGIPSVIYGVFGLGIIVPMIDKMSNKYPQGESLLAVIIVLSVMILPTVIT
ncbi:MAG: phosphate ABC transporter permease subunit PstC, partial [Vallitaleaceae bacterium]|nr:phosphate ABC transporter permease subunit PstC [Vallitaleaceae bacterium]